ncbi:hypothetical protein XPR_4211, partial [Xanthomonas arboricola pv. pruni MAFF 301420]
MARQRGGIGFGQRAFFRAGRIREAEALLQGQAAGVDRLQIGALALALLVEGNQKRVLAAHEGIAALA